MKKILLALIVGVLLSCCVLSAVCFADDGNASSSAEEYKNTQEYILTKQFCENYGDRSKQDNEIKVANALADEFKAIDGMDVDLQTGINVETSQTTYQTANVVAKLDTSSKKIVVIGAHYDNAGTGEGAADNATGIVTMYLLAKRLAEVKSSLPFDVYFVAFGGEEQGLCGSKHFVKDLKQNGDSGNVLVMFNLDGIAGGDDLYVQCENKSTDLEKLLVASSKNLSTKLNVKPYAAGISARSKSSDTIKSSYSNASLNAQGQNATKSIKYGIVCVIHPLEISESIRRTYRIRGIMPLYIINMALKSIFFIVPMGRHQYNYCVIILCCRICIN